MKWTSAILLTATCIGLHGAAAVAADTALPLRKAGKWEQKTVMEEGGKKHEQALARCRSAALPDRRGPYHLRIYRAVRGGWSSSRFLVGVSLPGMRTNMCKRERRVV